MGNIEVFNQDSNFLITLFSLLLLLFTCFYDSRREKLFAPVWLLFAGLVIAMVPVIVLYAIFQQQLQDGMSMGSAVKG